MDSRKLKIARFIGILFIILGITYWIVSFFVPNTYSNERPDSGKVFSTNVVSREEVENSNGESLPNSSPSQSPREKPVATPTPPQGEPSSVLDPLNRDGNSQVPVPEGLEPTS